MARIHASDESVDPSQIERLTVAQALLLQNLEASKGRPNASDAPAVAGPRGHRYVRPVLFVAR